MRGERFLIILRISVGVNKRKYLKTTREIKRKRESYLYDALNLSLG